MKRAFLWLLLPYLLLGDIHVPYLSGPIVDEVGLLNEGEKRQLEGILLKLKQKAQGAILIPSSLQETDIESYSIKIAESWKLGRKGSDRGFLIVVAPHERRMRIETGYGLEGELPDAICKQIISNILSPYFKMGRYGDGLTAALIAISERLEIDPGVKAPTSNQNPPLITILILFIFVILFLVLRYQSPLGFYGGSRRRGPWDGWGGGGFGGGGGFSGGGGSFGGGGASGSW